ncbi:hypothetical protein J1N35_041354 [Gossypium stocksii]|uniref:Uncharacterized protein n=1 Tax=Gossypium stocksii TaxID=47602 RepID=A0A9D3ZJC4_9ROSI|nr:hypothetical protein J1N35_041354 [Gossypium stocksii]
MASIDKDEAGSNAKRKAHIRSFDVKRILVESGSTVEVLSWDVYRKIGLKEQALSKASQLYSFETHPIEVTGSIIC